MKKLFVCFLLLFTACSFTVAQSDQDKEKAIFELRTKVHQLELYNMILPVVMTKDQLKTVLKVIEKCRSKSRDLVDKEYKNTRTLISEVDDAINAAATKGEVPSQKLIDQLFSASTIAAGLNKAQGDENTDDVYSVVMGTLNKGQIQAMANSLSPKEFPELLKNPDEVTQEQKVKIFCRAVLLDPDAYQVLVKLSL